MDQSDKNTGACPPAFNKPPSPPPAQFSAVEIDRTHEFILHCINREKEQARTNHQHVDTNAYITDNDITKNFQPPVKKRARTHYNRRSKIDPLLLTGILKNPKYIGRIATLGTKRNI